jgi:hypothetical protein
MPVSFNTMEYVHLSFGTIAAFLACWTMLEDFLKREVSVWPMLAVFFAGLILNRVPLCAMVLNGAFLAGILGPVWLFFWIRKTIFFDNMLGWGDLFMWIVAIPWLGFEIFIAWFFAGLAVGLVLKDLPFRRLHPDAIPLAGYHAALFFLLRLADLFHFIPPE